MTQTGQNIIAMHIFINVSRSNGNKTLKFGQLVEYTVVNIFLENPKK